MTSFDAKLRKLMLAKKYGLCAFCRLHRGENRSGRSPRPDRYKSWRKGRV